MVSELLAVLSLPSPYIGFQRGDPADHKNCPHFLLYPKRSSKNSSSSDSSTLFTKEGCTRVSCDSVMEVTVLPSPTTSQQAELTALTHALTLAKHDTCLHRFHMCISHTSQPDATWAERGRLISQSSSVTNASYIKVLLQAALPQLCQQYYTVGDTKDLQIP